MTASHANPNGARMDHRLRRSDRLLKAAEFQEIYNGGEHYVGRYMVLWIRKGDVARSRVGVVASRKVGGAVARNRAKRRLREVFRLNRLHLSRPVSVVLVARRTCAMAQQKDVHQEFLNLATRAGILGPGS